MFFLDIYYFKVHLGNRTSRSDDKTFFLPQRAPASLPGASPLPPTCLTTARDSGEGPRRRVHEMSPPSGRTEPELVARWNRGLRSRRHGQTLLGIRIVLQGAEMSHEGSDDEGNNLQWVSSL